MGCCASSCGGGRRGCAGGCCGRHREPEPEELGVATKRRPRDVLFLLIFICFWVGMIYIAAVAYRQGDARKLEYGVDSFGNLCGADNTNRGGPDLSHAKKLFFLNPLQLLDPTTYLAAASICVTTCPGAESLCDVSALPCRSNTQYRCPYYSETGAIIARALPGMNAASTQYWANLTATTLSPSACGIDIGWVPHKFRAAFWANVTDPACGEYLQLASQYPDRGPCFPVLAETEDYLSRCLPVLSTALRAQIIAAATGGNGSAASSAAPVLSSLSASGQRLQRYILDIQKGFAIIVVAGLVVGGAMSVVWMLMLRFAAGLIAWLMIVAANALCIACTILAFTKSGALGTWGAVGAELATSIPLHASLSAYDARLWLIAGYMAAALTALLLLVSLIMLPRVKALHPGPLLLVAVACMKVAAQALACMPSLLLYPVVPFLFVVGLVAYWVAVAALLYSCGSIVPHYLSSAPTPYTLAALYDAPGNATMPTPFAAPPPPPLAGNGTLLPCAHDPQCYYGMSWNTNLQYTFLYHLFGLLWGAQFIVGCGYVTVAAAVGHFYWACGNRAHMPKHPVPAAMRMACLFHLGSVALGSFFVALVQFVRIVLEYLERESKWLMQRQAALPWLKWALRAVQCLLWLLEKLVKFINRNAYILVAVQGKAYCASAVEAAKLLLCNALRVVAVSSVGALLVWMGKVSVMATSGVVAVFMSNMPIYNDPVNHPEWCLTSPLFPILLSLLVGYVIADIFFSVYDMAVETIFISFCEDSERHGGAPQCAPPLLLHAIGRYAKPKDLATPAGAPLATSAAMAAASPNTAAPRASVSSAPAHAQ